MNVYTISIRLVINPLAIKYITVYMPKFSFSVSFIVFPFTFVSSLVRPGLGSFPISFSTYPLSIINSTTFKFKWFPFFSYLTVNIHILVKFDRIIIPEIIISSIIFICRFILFIFLSRFESSIWNKQDMKMNFKYKNGLSLISNKKYQHFLL